MKASKRNLLVEFARDLEDVEAILSRLASRAARVGASPLMGRVAFFRQDLRGARRKIEGRLGIPEPANTKTQRVQ